MSQRVGPYELLRRLGQGGSGVVYEALDTRLQRLVALKCLPGQDARSTARGLREARLTARMKHPAFVTLFEVLHEGGSTFLVMELIDGRTLGEISAARPVPEPLIKKWALQAAEALHASHQLRVIHGDIKPSNLMIDAQGRVRIFDLGIANLQDAVATLGDPADASPGGTLSYMAPELLVGAPPSVASDIFALGLTIHEVAARASRPAPVTGFALAQQRLNRDIELSRDGLADEDFFALLCAMTRRDPEQRPVDLGEVISILRRCDGMSDLRVPALDAGGATTAARPGRRKRTWTVFSSLGLGVLLAVALTFRVGGVPPTALEILAAERQLRMPDDTAGIDRAIALFETVLAVQRSAPARVAASLAIAYCIRYAGNARDAVWLQRADASAQLAIGAEDQLALAHTARAWVLELQGDLTQAQVEYERAITLDPTDFHALNGQAQLLMKQHRADAAIQVFQRALHIHPDEPTFLNGLGTAQFERGDLDAAEATFRRSVAAHTTGPVSYANLNAVLTRQGRMDEALSTLQLGLARGPDARLYGNLGTTLFALGRYVEAADAFERALSADKGSPNDYRNWANLADTLRMIPGRQQVSGQAYRRALALLRPQLQPGADPTLSSRAGLYAAKVGEAAQAQTWTTTALQASPADGGVLFRAAVVAELAGDRATALQRIHGAMGSSYSVRAVEEEPELQALRRDRRFHQLMFNAEKKP